MQTLATKKSPLIERAPVDIRDELLTTEEAADLTKMSRSWFEKKRFYGAGGPPYVKRGRTVRYLRSELLTWFSEGRPVTH